MERQKKEDRNAEKRKENFVKKFFPESKANKKCSEAKPAKTFISQHFSFIHSRTNSNLKGKTVPTSSGLPCETIWGSNVSADPSQDRTRARGNV